MFHMTSLLSFDPIVMFKENDTNLAFAGVSWKFSIDQTAVDDVQDFFAEPEQHQRGRGCHQQHTKMNARWRLAEHGHDGGIGVIRSRKFHVVGQRVRRKALKNQLPGVGIFALVALQRQIQQPQPRGGDEEQHGHREPAEPDSFCIRNTVWRGRHAGTLDRNEAANSIQFDSRWQRCPRRWNRNFYHGAFSCPAGADEAGAKILRR